MIRAGIVGGSGYTGGELLRLLHFHTNHQSLIDAPSRASSTPEYA